MLPFHIVHPVVRPIQYVFNATREIERRKKITLSCKAPANDEFPLRHHSKMDEQNFESVMSKSRKKKTQVRSQRERKKKRRKRNRIKSELSKNDEVKMDNNRRTTLQHHWYATRLLRTHIDYIANDSRWKRQCKRKLNRKIQWEIKSDGQHETLSPKKKTSTDRTTKRPTQNKKKNVKKNWLKSQIQVKWLHGNCKNNMHWAYSL